MEQSAKRKLFVYGCSFSARTQSHRCYGDYLSDLLDLEHHHHALGGGSNDRIWRLATKHILDGDIGTDDVILVQYTDIQRREFASHDTYYNQVCRETVASSRGIVGDSAQALQRNYGVFGKFYTTNYKSGSHAWQYGEINQQLHRIYEQACASNQFNLEYFCTRHNQFGALCDLLNLNLVVYWSSFTSTVFESSLFKFGIEHVLDESTLDSVRNTHWYLGHSKPDENPGDFCHLNDHGHEQMAMIIADFLKNQQLV